MVRIYGRINNINVFAFYRNLWLDGPLNDFFLDSTSQIQSIITKTQRHVSVIDTEGHIVPKYSGWSLNLLLMVVLTVENSLDVN